MVGWNGRGSSCVWEAAVYICLVGLVIGKPGLTTFQKNSENDRQEQTKNEELDRVLGGYYCSNLDTLPSSVPDVSRLLAPWWSL